MHVPGTAAYSSPVRRTVRSNPHVQDRHGTPGSRRGLVGLALVVLLLVCLFVVFGGV